ncbi:hypothetical protein WCLP8_4270008 [uncultured Gammaproteobacteria bacterium]
MVTKGPGPGREDNFNLGIYRMQVLGRNKTLYLINEFSH